MENAWRKFNSRHELKIRKLICKVDGNISPSALPFKLNYEVQSPNESVAPNVPVLTSWPWEDSLSDF